MSLIVSLQEFACFLVGLDAEDVLGCLVINLFNFFYTVWDVV